MWFRICSVAAVLIAVGANAQQACSTQEGTCEPSASDGDDEFATLSLHRVTKNRKTSVCGTSIVCECDTLKLANFWLGQAAYPVKDYDSDIGGWYSTLFDTDSVAGYVTVRKNPTNETLPCSQVPLEEREPMSWSDTFGVQDLSKSTFLYLITGLFSDSFPSGWLEPNKCKFQKGYVLQAVPFADPYPQDPNFVSFGEQILLKDTDANNLWFSGYNESGATYFASKGLPRYSQTWTLERVR